jgi:hypothetical protein
MERPAALWNHFEAQQNGDELPPPYGIAHLVKGTKTLRCRFAIDSMCSPISVIKESLVQELGLLRRKQTVITSLADETRTPVTSTEMVTCELVVHWNGKRRTTFIDAMIWEKPPGNQDIIVAMPDALDTGLIAFALPHEWRRSWLGTACFSNQLPLALRQDQSMAAAAHAQFIMSPEDEDTIDISARIGLSKAHIITDVSTLKATQQYWLSQFPTLNLPIPKVAHPDLPKFNPPFKEALMESYLDKPDSKVPRTSPKLQDRINEVLGSLNEEGITNNHANPVGVASYIVLIPKPDGSLRICINFAKVNKILLVHHHPLPACADLLNQLARKKFFSKIDLRHGFFNFDMHENAKWLTSTIAPGHAITWNKIPQGLAPVPNWFQWAMQTIFSELIAAGICLIYLDDLIIMGNTAAELEANIRLVLERLAKYDLRISIQKCDFECNSSIEFLGHTIKDGKISPGPKSSKILEGIVNPNDESADKDKNNKLNTFIGIANWFSKYIPDCQRKIKPLLDARANGWTWGGDQETAFKMFKDILANLQPLHMPSGGDNKLEVHTDASKDGYFCVLFEDTGEGEACERLKVIAYTGGVFRGPQLAWSILQKEMFAVFQAHLKFDHFIRLHEFKLVIDNKTMCYCETSADLMVQRWYLRIQHYQSEIIHLPGILNILPDAGSRLLHLEHPNFVTAQFATLTSAIHNSKRIGTRVTRSCTLALRQALASRQLEGILEQLDESIPVLATDDTTIRHLQTLLRDNSVNSTAAQEFFSPACNAEAHKSTASSQLNGILEDPHEQDSDITRSVPDSTTQAWCSSEWRTQPPRGPNSCSTVHMSEADLSELLQETKDSASTQAEVAASQAQSSHSTSSRFSTEHTQPQRTLPIHPDKIHLIRQCHGGCAGHHGRDETIRKLQNSGHSWPTRFIDVARFIASCPTCQRHRLKQKTPYAQYKSILTDAPLFGRWHMDFLSIGSACEFTGATKILCMQEERSRYVILHACKAETSIEVVLAFLQTFAIFGIPESIRSDNAPNLAAAAVKQFIEITGIAHDFSVPHQAHTNGLIESTCGDTGRLLRMLCCDLHAYGRWSFMLPLVQRQLNSLTRATTGTTASHMLFGARVNLDRYIIPTAPMYVDPATRDAIRQSDTVQTFCDTLLVAQQDILFKADQIRAKILSDLQRQRPYLTEEQPQAGHLVLVPWNDTNTRPDKLSANMMGPYVITSAQQGKNTVTLAHTIIPNPQNEPATLVSAVADLKRFDDSLALAEYDVPENRFRQLAYANNNTRAVNCILSYRPLRILTADASNDVRNMEYEVRFENSVSLTDTHWLRYCDIGHTFAFNSFWQFVQRQLVGHRCIALPEEFRHVHQVRSVAAARNRRNASRLTDAAATFDQHSMAFHPT